MTEAKYIWMDGEFVNWHDAKVHVLSHTLHYGNGAIEGTKAYKTVDGRCAIFKLNEHTKRLLNSSKMTLMNVPFTLEELNKAQIELLQKNELSLVSSTYADNQRYFYTLWNDSLWVYTDNNYKPVQSVVSSLELVWNTWSYIWAINQNKILY